MFNFTAGKLQTFSAPANTTIRTSRLADAKFICTRTIEGSSLAQDPDVKSSIAKTSYLSVKEFDIADPINPAAPVTTIFDLLKISLLGGMSAFKSRSVKIY